MFVRSTEWLFNYEMPFMGRIDKKSTHTFEVFNPIPSSKSKIKKLLSSQVSPAEADPRQKFAYLFQLFGGQSNKYLQVDFGVTVSPECANVLRNHIQ